VSQQAVLVVGLGNPDPPYALNRHNLGFLAVDYLAEELGASWKLEKKLHGFVAQVPLQSVAIASIGSGVAAGSSAVASAQASSSAKLFLLKPTTYMNNSGQAVSAVCKYFHIDRVIVVNDEMDVPFGAIKIKVGGGNAGHNGILSIDNHLKRPYTRVRGGISRPKYQPGAAYVLENFTKAQQKELFAEVLPLIAAAVLDIVQNGTEHAQTKFNAKK
jgi:PTH1 family peptidyl-tRNA hydrolase